MRISERTAVSKSGGFIHWLELEAQGHTGNSAAGSLARSITFQSSVIPTPWTQTGLYSLPVFHKLHNVLAKQRATLRRAVEG